MQDKRGRMVSVCCVKRSLTECFHKQSGKYLHWCGHVNACIHICMIGCMIWSQTVKQVIHIPETQHSNPLSRLLGPLAKDYMHEYKAGEYVGLIVVCVTPSTLTTKEVEQISANDVELQRLKLPFKQVVMMTALYTDISQDRDKKKMNFGLSKIIDVEGYSC